MLRLLQVQLAHAEQDAVPQGAGVPGLHASQLYLRLWRQLMARIVPKTGRPLSESGDQLTDFDDDDHRVQ
jgi:hypothetical protein